MFDVFTIQHKIEDLFSNLETLDVVIEIDDLEKSEKSVKSKIASSRQTTEESKQKDVFNSEELERIEDLIEDAENTANDIFRLKRKIINKGLEWDEFGISISTKDTKDLKDQFEVVRYLQFEIKEVVGRVVERSNIEFRQAMRIVERALILTWLIIGLSLVLAVILAYNLVKSVKKIYDLKNEFVNIIAHDLRNPVTAIRGYVELITTDGKHQSKSKLNENLQAINVSVHKLSIQINNLLEVGRSDAGRLKINIESINPFEVINESTLRAKALAEISGIKILKEKAENEKLFISADRSKLSDVLDNLISNAIKYNRQNGTVTVSSRETTDMFSISVTDTGQGIPENQRDKIFKKYSRLDTEKEKKVRGTGLGLYTVKLAMDQMGGSATFETEVDKGTTFTVTFKKDGKVIEKKEESQKRIENKEKVTNETKKS
jgi:signal transduction histidine kinase